MSIGEERYLLLCRNLDHKANLTDKYQLIKIITWSQGGN